MQEEEAERTYVCEECGQVYPSHQARQSHAARRHGHRRWVAKLIGGPHRQACGKFFRTRLHALDHVQFRAKRCAEWYRARIPELTLSAEAQEQLAIADRAEHRAARQSGRGVLETW